MALGIAPPRVRTHREADGTWTGTLYIEGRWHGQLRGFATASEARAAVRRHFLGAR